MATIGTFTKQLDGSYAGSIKTLSLNVKAAQLRPNEKSDEKAPDFRIFAGQTEFGAAWKKTSRENRDYLSVKLDDPSFAAPIYGSLVETDAGFSLIWARSLCSTALTSFTVTAETGWTEAVCDACNGCWLRTM